MMMAGSKRKKVVLHVPSLRGGGAERVFVLIANEMAARGHAVILFVWNSEGPNMDHVDPRVRLVSLGTTIHGEGFGKRATLNGLMKTVTFLRRERPDAVFSAPEFANLVTACALILAASRSTFFPTYHAAATLETDGMGSRIAPLLGRVVAWRATKAIAVSRGIAHELVARGFARDRITVINNPLPPQEKTNVQSYTWQVALQNMGDGPVIITLGRLVEVKDHRTLLKAFSLLDLLQPPRLVIFGEGPLLESLRSFADELGVGSRVLFAGYVNDPRACYAVADLFVLSSRSEGFGNVLIEAMASGVPIVSTDAPHGPREILNDGLFGRLVPVGDPNALAHAMTEALANRIHIPDLKKRAADFTIAIIGGRYEELILQCENALKFEFANK